MGVGQQSRGAFPRPVFLDLCLTDNCNCRCDYCFAGHPRHRSSLSYPAAKSAVDMLLDFWEGGEEPGAVFFGGEPLLEFDLIRYAVEYAERRAAAGAPRINWSMTTNGTLMTEPMMIFFAAHKIHYLLSIDGPRETHDAHRKLRSGKGSFDRLSERLPLMKSYQPWLGARVTPTPETVGGLCRGVDELCDIGINQFIIGMASGVKWTEESAAVFAGQILQLHEVYLKRIASGFPMRFTLFEKGGLEEERDTTSHWGCGAGRGRMCVNPRGELSGCARFAAMNNGKGALKLGDVWRGAYEQAVRKDLGCGSVWRRPACVDCAYQSECVGGCPAVNYQDTGSIFDPSPTECLSTRIYAQLKDQLARRPAPAAAEGRKPNGR